MKKKPRFFVSSNMSDTMVTFVTFEQMLDFVCKAKSLFPSYEFTCLERSKHCPSVLDKFSI